MTISRASTATSRAAAALLGLLVVAGPGLAQDEGPKAIAKIMVKVSIEISIEIKKHGFPVFKPSGLGDAKVLERSFTPYVGAAEAKRAAACYAWGGYYATTNKKEGQQVLVTLFACKSSRSAQTMIEVMEGREAGMNKAMEEAGVELGRKKLVQVKVPDTSKAYAYERLLKPKGQPETKTIKLVVASGRYVVEVTLVGSRNKALVKAVTRAALVGLGQAEPAKKEE